MTSPRSRNATSIRRWKVNSVFFFLRSRHVPGVWEGLKPNLSATTSNTTALKILYTIWLRILLSIYTRRLLSTFCAMSCPINEAQVSDTARKTLSHHSQAIEASSDKADMPRRSQAIARIQISFIVKSKSLSYGLKRLKHL